MLYMCVTFVQKYTFYLFLAKVVPFLCFLLVIMVKKVDFGLVYEKNIVFLQP